jgi:rsbT co-antagonist protein RsbR
MMVARISSWLKPVSPHPDVARQEYVLNWVLVGLASTSFIYGLATLIAWAIGPVPILGALLGFGALPCYALAYGLGRRGHLGLAAFVLVVVPFLLVLLAQYQFGLGHSTMIGLAMATVVAGILLGTWWTLGMVVLCTSAYFLLGLVQQAGRLPAPLQPAETLVADGVAMGLGLLALAVLVRFSQYQSTHALARAHESEQRAQSYAQELAAIQGRLERQVEERTQELTEFAHQLEHSLEEQQRLWETVQRLSIPIVPVHEGVIVMPLIGQIDPPRAARLVDDMLVAVEEQDAQVVIIDITGVAAMDVQVANSLIEAASAARLLGTELVLVGIRPDVADAVVRLSLSLEGITTQRDLQAGVRYALARTARAGDNGRAGRDGRPAVNRRGG